MPRKRAAGEGGPLDGDARDGEALDRSGILNGDVQFLEDAASIDEGEEVRWLDGAVSDARSSEVVRSRD